MNRRDIIKAGIGATVAGIPVKATMQDLVPQGMESVAATNDFSAVTGGITATNMRLLSDSAKANDCTLHNSLHDNRIAKFYRTELLEVQKKIQEYAMTGHRQFVAAILGGTPTEISAVVRMIEKKLVADGFGARPNFSGGRDYLYNSLNVSW